MTSQRPPANASADVKLRPGAAVEVYSDAVDAWLDGQVVSLETESRVVVEYQLEGTLKRRTVHCASAKEMRTPQGPVEERCTIAPRHSQDLKEAGPGLDTHACAEAARGAALKQLRLLEARERELLTASPPVEEERVRAEVKWNRARKTVEACKALEFWCSGKEDLNGTYALVDTPGAQGAAPVFRHRERPERWLFLSTVGSWWIGDEDCKEQRQAKGWLRTRAVQPGTLPCAVEAWELPRSGVWEPQDRARCWLSESVAVAWQRLRVAAFGSPVLQVHGVGDGHLDGLYDFVPQEGTLGAAPSFQHQQRPNLWLFLARDQRWWIGSTAAKEARDDRGLLHSAPVQPGTHPADAFGWHIRTAGIWEERRGLRLHKQPGALQASELWAQACARAEKIVQLWGKEHYHGDYRLAGSVDGVPAYQYSRDPGVWLFLAMDGCWWLADAACKDARRARGYIRSGVVAPGTLPHEVTLWQDLHVTSWQANEMARVLCPGDVEREWQTAWEAVNRPGRDVIELSGVMGPGCNGLFDLVLPTGNGKDKAKSTHLNQPPRFQQQINQELFLYVARDGRWWVSDEQCMRRRDPLGRVHSDVIRPGMLPVCKHLSWHVYNHTTKEWERQDGIIIE